VGVGVDEGESGLLQRTVGEGGGRGLGWKSESDSDLDLRFDSRLCSCERDSGDDERTAEGRIEKGRRARGDGKDSKMSQTHETVGKVELEGKRE